MAEDNNESIQQGATCPEAGSGYVFGHSGAQDPSQTPIGNAPVDGFAASEGLEEEGSGRPDFERAGELGEEGNDCVPRKPLSEWTTREVGVEGERIAAEYLARHNYEILDRNWACPFGEADIIARDTEEDRDGAILVEVKTRVALGPDADDMPELAVDACKRKRYRKIALAYLTDHDELHFVRFDVIAINIVGERNAKLRHLLGAYGWED
ncbi:MAG: YraN family protein [Tractidigestivibacter sp.]|uniref:YraN family protein n=1 Tax=Tractidigestivibacter sp. TaxID=2847320 RepID=UPI003D90C528